MHSSGSLLKTTVERIRTYLDDPSLDAKYSDDFIVRHIIEPEIINVLTAINMDRDDPVYCKMPITIDSIAVGAGGVVATGAELKISSMSIMSAGAVLSLVDAKGVTHTITEGVDWVGQHSSQSLQHARGCADIAGAISRLSGCPFVTRTITLSDVDDWTLPIDQRHAGAGGNTTPTVTGSGWSIEEGFTSGVDGPSGITTPISLNPNIGTILRIVETSGDSVIGEVPKRDETDPRGGGWRVDGRSLFIEPGSTVASSTYEIWYIPSGDFPPHYSAGTGNITSVSETGLSMTLHASPDLGSLDMRESSYIGGVLRVWNAGNTIVEERVIDQHDVSEGKIGWADAPLSADIGTGTGRQYEIVPEFMGHLWQAVAVAGAINLGVARNINEKQMAFLKEQFQLALQSARAKHSNKVESNNNIYPENSVLSNIVERIRWGLPDQIESTMSNDYIMRSAVGPKLAEVSTMVNGRSDSQTVVRQDITFVEDQEFYNLPPCVGKVLRISKLSTTIKKGLVVDEIRQRDENDPNGEGWSVQGLRLSMRPIPFDYVGSGVEFANYTIWYTPSGDFMPHYANDGTMSGSGKILSLTRGGTFSRQLGTVDIRDNAYLGATLRVFETDGSISERTITAHNAASETITVTEAFTTTSGTVAYEIVTPWMHTIMSAVVARSVLELVALKGQIPESDMAILAESAKSSLTAAMMNAREKNAQEIVPNKDSSLHMILEKTKTILSDVAKELDYSDDYIFRHGIVPEYSRVMSRIQNTSSDYIIAKTTVSFVKDQQYYELPSCVGEIMRIVTMYDDGRIKTELLPRSQYHTSGPNWSIEGNRLSIRPFPQSAEDVEIWYIPTVDVKPHYAEDGKVNGTRTTVSLSRSEGGWGSSILGDIDRRNGIYQGCLMRVITNKGEIEERIIDEYIMNAAEATGYPSSVILSSSLTETTLSNKIVSYEILPSYFHAAAEAVAQGAAMNLLVGARRVTKAQHVMLLSNFKSAMKTAMDHHTFKQNRIPKSYDKDTVDNRNKYGGLYGIR